MADDTMLIVLVIAAGAYVTNLLCAPFNLCFSGLGAPAAAAAPAAPAAAAPAAPKGYPAGYSAAAYRSYAAHVSVA